MNGLEALSCVVHPRAGDQSVHKAALILFIIHNTWDGLTQNSNYYSGPLWHHHMWLDLSDFPCPYSRIASNQRLEIGTAWEQGLEVHVIVLTGNQEVVTNQCSVIMLSGNQEVVLRTADQEATINSTHCNIDLP